MKIALLGYGKMGKAIETFCLKNTNHQIVKILTEENASDLSTEFLAHADVAIDFSTPHVAVKHINTCFAANVPVVSGTTGWLDEWENITKQCKETNGALFYSSNFSLGVNLFWKIITKAAEILNHSPYQVRIDETHHIHKVDAPSGTAITTAEKLITQLKQYTNWQLGETNQKNILPIVAHRKGEVHGTHLVTFANEIDQISIEHQAMSREGFVSGAIKAAEFVVNKTGIYGMDDLLNQ